MVRVQRDALERGDGPQLVLVAERLIGRTVRTFLSGSSTLGGSSVEVFVLEPAPSGQRGAPWALTPEQSAIGSTHNFGSRGFARTQQPGCVAANQGR